MTKLNDRLKQLRIKKELTQRELANLLHVSQNAIFNWENGKREPSAEMISKLANFFGVSPSFLMGWQEESTLIDKEIDKIIEHIKTTDGNQEEISKLTNNIRNLLEREKEIESKNRSVLAAHFEGEEFTEEEIEEIKQFAEFVKSKRKDAE